MAKKELPPVTTAVRTKANDNLRKARVQLVLNQPFFASIILRRQIALDDAVPTAYVTPSGHITMGTGFTAAQTVAQTMFVLAHETMHFAMLHHLRVGHRNRRAANEAMDKVINDILIESGLTPPVTGVFQPGAAKYAWEELYVDPPKRKKKKGEDGDGPCGGNDDGDDDDYEAGNGNDDLAQGKPLTAEQVEGIKQELNQARAAAKQAGKLGGALDKLLEGIVNPPTPWFSHLERFMTMLAKADLSWKRPRKALMPQGLYLPNQGQIAKMGTVVIQQDESGSITMPMLKHFTGHINKIIESCKPELVIVLHTSTYVAHVDEYTEEDFPIIGHTKTTGGTDMTAGFEWIQKMGIEPDAFICLTDGYTPFGEAQLYPVVWLCTTDVVAPHGETIPYEIVE